MSVDVIGRLWGPRVIPEGHQPGDPVPDAAPLWGFHVNVTPDLLEARPELVARVIHPVNLRRVWAGDDPAAPSLTVALRFNGENAAREALGDLWPTDA